MDQELLLNLLKVNEDIDFDAYLFITIRIIDFFLRKKRN